MSNKDLALWQGHSPAKIPSNETDVGNILTYAKQLTRRDISQVAGAIKNNSFEMASFYIWQKSLSLLKNQLSTLGVMFIAEMLDRPDIDEHSSLEQKISDYEAITLAEELGFINGTGALRLRQSYEKIHHFGSLDEEEADESPMTIDECVGIVRACVENVIGQDKIEAALDFSAFRNRLEEELFTAESREIVKLLQSPYFFKRTSIRILLSLIKTSAGAQLENVLANANLIVPLLWKEIKKPERWQIGRAYSEVYIEGKSKAASGLKKTLLKVKGFDYVPEDLRSNSYIKAANDVLAAHDAMSNFHNEPAPMKFLHDMGSVIPIPALSVCMTAMLSVKLGNSYGYSWNAESYADSLLDAITDEKWIYYLKECLPTDERIQYKLQYDSPAQRWCQLVRHYNLPAIAEDNISNKDILMLLQESMNDRITNVRNICVKLVKKLGYKA